MVTQEELSSYFRWLAERESPGPLRNYLMWHAEWGEPNHPQSQVIYHPTPDTSERESERGITILRIEYVLDLLLPPSRASDAQINLEDVYDQRWLPKYGPIAARLVFATQAAGLIWSFHSQRITKWLGGALGLMKLYGWYSGPRGG
jgi:hypothetical protein